MGLSPREQRILRDIERDLSADDPELARLLNTASEPAPLRRSRTPVLLLLCVTACFLAAIILLGRIATTSPGVDRTPTPKTASAEEPRDGSGGPPRSPSLPTETE